MGFSFEKHEFFITQEHCLCSITIFWNLKVLWYLRSPIKIPKISILIHLLYKTKKWE